MDNYTAQLLYELKKKKKEEELFGHLKQASSNPTQTGDKYTDDWLMELERIQKEKTMSNTVRQGLADKDIAPVRTNLPVPKKEKEKEEEKEKKKDVGLGYFEKGALSDIDYTKNNTHNQIAKAILGTTGDLALSFAKGIFRPSEYITDLAQYGGAEVLELFGKDEMAAKWKKNAQRNEVDEFFGSAQRSNADEKFDPVLHWDESLDKYSLLGEKSKGLAEGAGQVAGVILTRKAGAIAGLGKTGVDILTTSTMGASSMGSALTEAYTSEDGATDAEAWGYAAIAAASDVISEKLWGGLGKQIGATGFSHGLSDADDMLAKALTSKVKNTLVKNVAQAGVKMSFEGLEEILASVGQAIGEKITYKSEEDLWELIKDKKLWDQFFAGAFISGLYQAPGVYSSTKYGRELVTGTTQNEQKVIDRLVDDEVKKRDGIGLGTSKQEKAQMVQEFTEAMEHGQISIDTIEEVLGGDSYTAYKDAVAKEDEILAELKELYKGDELKAQTDELAKYSKRGELKEKLGADVREIIKNDRLMESYNEKTKRGQGYFSR